MSAAVSVNANFTGLNLLGLLQWLAGLAVGGWEATLLITAVGTPGHPPAFSWVGGLWCRKVSLNLYCSSIVLFQFSSPRTIPSIKHFDEKK